MEASGQTTSVPNITELPSPPERDTVIKAIEAIENGPRVMRTYMEICAKCGTCAEQCPVYYGAPEKGHNPAERSDLIRSIYKRQKTLGGRALGSLAGAHDYAEGEISEWVQRFYECTGCRRCATFCPFGIDNSVITRKGRAIIHSLGLTPQRLRGPAVAGEVAIQGVDVDEDPFGVNPSLPRTLSERASPPVVLKRETFSLSS